MFASRVKKPITVGETVVIIRKLSAKSLDKAREARSIEAMQNVARLGGEVLKAYREAAATEAAGTDANAKAAEPDPRAVHGSYDRDLVLLAGIESWNATDPDGKELSVSPDAVADLDEETANLLFHDILDLSLPKAAEITEALSKND